MTGRKEARAIGGGPEPVKVAAAAVVCLLAVAPAAADGLDEAGGRWISIAVLSGATQPDRDLADYQWDASPRVGWGAQALAATGRWAAGPRFWTASTTQRVDSQYPGSGTTVRWTSWELVGRGRLATFWGNDLVAVTSAGRLHLAYDPDRVTIDESGTPVVVDLEPVDEWIVGAGMSLQRRLGARWGVGLEVDHRLFGFETAHRNGKAIEYARESFGDWSARLELARRFGWR